jgi:hypothetical protein
MWLCKFGGKSIKKAGATLIQTFLPFTPSKAQSSSLGSPFSLQARFFHETILKSIAVIKQQQFSQFYFIIS